jgi:F-type H+-transporting ATPase subunit b
MKQREDYIAGEITSAEEKNKEAQQLIEEQRVLLKEARQESQHSSKMRKNWERSKKKRLFRLHVQESERLKEAARTEIVKEKEQAVSALREQVASLSVMNCVESD